MEVAHDVAISLIERHSTGPADPDTGDSFDALVRRAVTNRLRNLWRGSQRRAAAERVHHEERSRPDGSQSPQAHLEANELSHVVQRAIADMPDIMRRVFLLVRHHEMSYREVAARLGIAIGTVHAHLSRANVRLRQAVDDYNTGANRGADAKRQVQPTEQRAPSRMTETNR